MGVRMYILKNHKIPLQAYWDDSYQKQQKEKKKKKTQQKAIRVGEDVDKVEPSHAPDRNIKWCSQ